jgi:hypothetical protein
MQAGILTQRQFYYHNIDSTLSDSHLSPFVTLQLHWLFKLAPPEKVGPDIESGRFETPVFKSLLNYL